MSKLAMEGCTCKKWKEMTKNDHNDSITQVVWNGNKLTFKRCPWCGRKLNE